MIGVEKVLVRDLVLRGEAELTTGPFGTQLKAGEYVEYGIPLINVRNVGFGEVRATNLEYLSEDTATRLNRHRLEAGDIVFGRKGAVERHAYISDDQAGWVQGSDCLRLRLRSPRFVPRFVSYFLLTEHHMQWMKNHCSGGATMASLNQDILGRIALPLAALPAQRKIAAILSAYDDLIENNNRRILLLEEMAQRIYREWFVDFRYPGYESIPLVESELGPVPKEWEVSPVGAVTPIVGGGTPSKVVPEYWEAGTITWYTPTDLTGADAMFMSTSKIRITAEGLARSSARLFPAGSVMMTSRATIGVVSITTVPASTNQGFITCLTSERVGSFHLYFWLLDQRDLIISLASGATFKEINKATFRQIPFLRASTSIESAFERLVEPIGEEIQNLLLAQHNLRATRDLLLPRLISGDLDVTDLDIQVPEEAA